MFRSYYVYVMAFLFLGVCVAMFTPGLQPPFGFSHSFSHFAVFFMSGLLLFGWQNLSEDKAILLLVFFVFSLEAAQFFVPGRTVEVMDIVYNFYGVFGAYLVWSVWCNMRRRAFAKI